MTQPDKHPQAIRRALIVSCACLWVFAFVATHWPQSDLPRIETSDKVLHFIGYLALGMILLGALMAHGLERARRIAIVAITLAVYGALDEITQPIVGRVAAFGDWLADVGGALAAIVILELAAWLLLVRSRRGTTNP